MLTLSERWLTTQTSVLVRAATATGSRPTGTDAVCVRPVGPTSKISSRLSGVLTAKRRAPSGDSASGRTWPLSKVVNVAETGAAPSAHQPATASQSIPRDQLGMAQPDSMIRGEPGSRKFG